ncbi:MAG: hypothetical protein QOI87_554 [Bradyrhizobium sp.]|nr:hypothetical protein [Bradyrhizobium sp.]
MLRRSPPIPSRRGLRSSGRLLQQVSDPATTEGPKGPIADLENRLRNLLDPE